MNATPLRQALGQIRDGTLSIIFPALCRVCGAPVTSWRDGLACASCWQAAEHQWLNVAHCVKCDAVLPALSVPAGAAPPERTCPHCRDFAFSCARACGAYEDAVRETVQELKLQPHLTPRLRTLLLDTFQRHPQLHDCESIIPVPLHATRLTERGHNQAEFIATALARQSGLPLDTASLVRAKVTERHRAGMNLADRAKSMRKAFRVRAPRLIQNKTILLVDDVMTSGSTAHEIAHTLLTSGARQVNVLTLARAITRYI